MLGIIIQLNQCLSVGTNNKFWGEPKECQTTNPNHEAMAECEPRRGHGKRTPIRKDWLENPLGRPWTKKNHLMSLGKQRQTAANPVLYIILVAVQQQQQQNKTKQNKKRTHVRVFTSPFSRQLLWPIPISNGYGSKMEASSNKNRLTQTGQNLWEIQAFKFRPMPHVLPPPYAGGLSTNVRERHPINSSPTSQLKVRWLPMARKFQWTQSC